MNFKELSEKYTDSMIEDLRQLIAIPSLLDLQSATEHAPFGVNVRKSLDWMLEKAKADGFDVLDIDGYAGVISFGQGEESVGVLGHLDIVPIGEGWTKDPFGGEIVDGIMYGRGTGDDKGPTMAAYTAMKMLKDIDPNPKRKIMLIVGCDEETGMRCMKHYLEVGEIPTMGFVPDAGFPVIYGEKGILNVKLSGKHPSVISSFHAGERPNIVIGKASVTIDGPVKKDELDFYAQATRTFANYTVNENLVTYTFMGTYSHASTPQHGLNAAVHALNFVGVAYNDTAAAQMSQLVFDYHGRAINNFVEGAHMGNLTSNLGIVSIENGMVELTLDIRYPNDVSFDMIMDKLNRRVLQVAPWLSIDVIAHKEPMFVDPQSELVSTLMNVYQEMTGDTFTPALTMGGGTYARTLPNFVAFGMQFPKRNRPDFVGDAHQKDEGIFVEDLVLATAIYAEALKRLAYENA